MRKGLLSDVTGSCSHVADRHIAHAAETAADRQVGEMAERESVKFGETGYEPVLREKGENL